MTTALPGGQDDPDRTSPGTREMAALLRERAALVNPEALSLIVNDRRADMLSALLARPLPMGERLQLRGRAVLELANAGRPRDALKALQALEQDAREADPTSWQRYRVGARLVEAMAYMRLAEDENCHAAPGRDACLLPIKGQGVHKHREGGEGAVRALLEVLSQDPTNLRARWLLNIAHMTLGSYPDGVPERHRIAPSVFASEHPLPRFDNVADEAGLDLSGLAGGMVLEDFDGDRRLDVLRSAMGFHEQTRFLRNKGDGTFEDRTREAGLTGLTGGLNMVPADYDNDGNVDALVLRGGWLGSEGRFPLSLLKSDGRGGFSDVTRAAGLLGHLAPTQTATWFDFDANGSLDLFVGNESAWIPDFVSGQRADSFPCELYRNNGDGTFTEMAKSAGLEVSAFVKGTTSLDYDNDGRPDLYVSIWGGPNRLYRNEGPALDESGWRFKEVTASAGVSEPRFSFATFAFDYDNDGWQDLFVAGYGSPRGVPTVEDVAGDYLGMPTDADRDRLYRNQGDGSFEDVTKAAGLYRVEGAMALNIGDLDNDGWLDFYTGTGTPDLGMLVPNRMFRNDAGKRFQDVTTAGNFGHLQKGHAIAFGDYDNDGDQDVVEQMGGAYLGDTARTTLYRNPGAPGRRFVGIELEGVRSNRRGVGARLELVVETASGRRSIHRTVSSGGSFGGNPMRQEIGLGEAARIAWLEIRWPVTGLKQRVTGLSSGRRYLVREGREKAEEVVWPGVTPRASRAASSAGR